MKGLIILVIGWILAIVGKIWAVISLLGWLFNKIDSFNLISVIVLVIGYVAIFTGYFMMASQNYK